MCVCACVLACVCLQAACVLCTYVCVYISLSLPLSPPPSDDALSRTYPETTFTFPPNTYGCDMSSACASCRTSLFRNWGPCQRKFGLIWCEQLEKLVHACLLQYLIQNTRVLIRIHTFRAGCGHECAHIYIHVYTCVYKHISAYMHYAHAPKHTHTQSGANGACTASRNRIFRGTYIYMYTYVHIYMYIYMYISSSCSVPINK